MPFVGEDREERAQPEPLRAPAAGTPVGQDRIWDYFQTEAADTFAGSRGRLGYLANRARGRGRVLNIGVGGGEFEELALSRGVEVYSLDPSAKTIERLRTRLPLGDRARVGYGQEIPFPDRYFGAVVVSEVFEHLTEEVVGAILQDIGRVLAPSGVLIGTVPARENLVEQTVVCPCCGEVFHRWGHLQRFDAERVRSVLEPFFQVQEVRERPFVTWEVLNWKGKLLASTKLVLSTLGVHGSGENIFFVAKPR